MGNVRAYDPNPVEPAATEKVRLSDYSFKLIQVEVADINKKVFTEKYKIRIPQQVRSRYSDDVVFGAEWRELLSDFDKKLFGYSLWDQIKRVRKPLQQSI